MKEVLSIQFDAATAALNVKVTSVKESAHVPGTFVRVLGVPEPEARIKLTDLGEHEAPFRALLAALVPMVESKHGVLASDPAALTAEASRLARREQEIEAAKLAADAEVAAKKAELAEIEKQIAAANAAELARADKPAAPPR